MVIDLHGKVAIITGGSKGLGLATAKEFATNGCSVAIVARDPESLKTAAADIHASTSKARVITISADMTKPTDIDRAYNEVMTQLKRVDIVVNNVGASAAKSFEKITDAEWQADFQLKLFSSIQLTRLAWPQMQERKWGRVLNSLAIAAKAPKAGSAPSSVTRAAGVALTKVLANEGAPFNILVNALLVGHIESDQWERRARTQNVPIDQFLTDLGKLVPLGRIGRAEEFANIACFLASEAGSFITGTAINVDGGMSPVV